MNKLVYAVFATLAIASVLHGCMQQPTPVARCQSGNTETERKAPGPRFEVRVAVDVCVEDREHVFGNGDYAVLECKADAGVYRILLARKEWLDMKRDGLGTTNPGPGK